MGQGWTLAQQRELNAARGRLKVVPPMRILLTNDDGIEAPGLDVLEKIATDLTDDVWVVAPETDNSGASHSLTLAEPLRMRDLGKRHYAVKGTPTDCVIMGVRFLLRDQPPDLVLSGVNRGQNLADDVTYSGTVAGAIQGTLLGVPSIAMSLVCGPVETGKEVREPPIWETPMQHGGELVRKLLDSGWPEGVVINVNFPSCEPGAVKGHRRDAAGPARSGTSAHRRPLRYARARLLLDRHRTAPRRATRGNRSLGGSLESHISYAALPRLHRPSDAQAIGERSWCSSRRRSDQRSRPDSSGTSTVTPSSSSVILIGLGQLRRKIDPVVNPRVAVLPFEANRCAPCAPSPAGAPPPDCSTMPASAPYRS